MQDLKTEQAFYADLFAQKPENEHITSGYDELHQMAMPTIPKGIVMDIGCGTGAHSIRLARRGCDVVAMDLTRQGAKAARERFRRENLKGRFLVADAERLPFRDGVAEVAWTFLLLHHFPELDKLPPELKRITTSKVIALEPNALNMLTWFANNIVNRFIGISAMTPNQRALWPNEIIRIFEAQGFELKTLEFVDRKWADKLGWVRGTYEAITAPLSQKYRANKFLVVFQKRAA
ncbi:MAG TPA: methyltransferase domain-containing protein [Gemmatimonadales bacterium]|jgi:ubiquinone/menaquinone biosynthesis C-methylase UbiE